VNVLDALPQDASVVVIRLRSLGDTVLTTPALRLLKSARQDLRITVVLDDAFAPLLEHAPNVDHLIRASRGHRTKTIRDIRKLSPDLCLNLHGGTSSALMTALSGAKYRAGFAHFSLGYVYNVKIPTAQEILGLPSETPVHTAQHLAAAAFHLGVPQQEIPTSQLAAQPLARDRPYAVLHVAAAYETKQWSSQHFRTVARHVAEQHNLEPVLIAGPGQDDLLDQFAGLTILPGLNIPRLKSLMAGASLFVGNDSGPAHIAAAFGKPCVVIFGSSNSTTWGPWGTRSAIVETAWDCKPCAGDRCYAFDEPRCILSVDASSVTQAVDRLLESS
jgi:heptosyltransferase-3